MNNAIKAFAIFATGAATGVLATMKYFEVKYSRLAQEEIDSVKEIYTYKKPESQSNDTTSEDDEPDSSVEVVEKPSFIKPDIMEYASILQKEGYAKKEYVEEEENEMTNPYIIDPDSFGDQYETVSLTYYADGVLEDDIDGVIEDPTEIVGKEFPDHFGEYEKDTVFVRNDEKQLDYEICRDNRKFTEITSNESWAEQ